MALSKGRIRLSGSSVCRQVWLLQAGDSFGELALLQEEARRTTTVSARGGVELLAIPKESYLKAVSGTDKERLLWKRIPFLTDCPPFFSLSKSQLYTLSYISRSVTYPRGCVHFPVHRFHHPFKGSRKEVGAGPFWRGRAARWIPCR